MEVLTQKGIDFSSFELPVCTDSQRVPTEGPQTRVPWGGDENQGVNSPPPTWQPQQAAQGHLVQGCDLSPVQRGYRCTKGAWDTLTAQPHARPN